MTAMPGEALFDRIAARLAARFHGLVSEETARRLVTDEIMAAIQQLSGQEEAGIYNERAPDA